MIALLRPKAVMPIHGEYRMQAAHAKLARQAGVPAAGIVMAENGSVVELTRSGVRLLPEKIESGVTFVDGLGVGDVKDVALRDRRQALGGRRPDHRHDARELERRHGAAGADRARLRRVGGAARRAARRGDARARAARVGRHPRDQAPAGAPARLGRPDRLRPDAPPADDSPRDHRGLAVADWPDILVRARAERADRAAADLPAPGLRGLGARVLPPARALGQGRAPSRRRRAAARPRSGTPPTASRPRSRASRRRSAATSSSSRPTRPRAAPGTPARARASSSSGRRCSLRAGVSACPNRVAAAYLELAVLVRALQGLSDAARMETTLDASSLWAGSSTSATPCSARRSTTSARSPSRWLLPRSRALGARAGVSGPLPVWLIGLAAAQPARPLRVLSPSPMPPASATT